MRHQLDFDMILRGIVMSRGESGATISEIRADYFDIVCQPWPLRRSTTDQIVRYLMEIDGLMAERLENGPYIWYIDDIGASLSERETDSNNNDIYNSVTMETVSDNTQTAANSSYTLPPPRARTTTPFVSGNNSGSTITSSSADTPLMDSVQKENRKRNLSDDSDSMRNFASAEKRQRLSARDRLPLIEKNLDIHNRHNGASSMAKKITSTEIENSISVQSESNGCLATTDYIEPIQAPISNQLQQDFATGCQIQDKKSSVQTSSESSADSTIFIEENLFPPGFGVIGDDFMRTLISFELFASDITERNEKQFGFCISGQTVREAFKMVMDKQDQLSSQYRYLIVNIGAIDILLEHDLIDIETDFAHLIQLIFMIGLQPIVTTVPHVLVNGNHPNEKIIRQTLLLFNNFLMNTYGFGTYLFVDLHASLFNGKFNDRITNYYNQPKSLSVDNKKLELWNWNTKGRKKIVEAIDACIKRIPAE